MTRRRPSDLLPSLGLFEAHLEVRDLNRSVAFYRDRLGLKLAYLLPERQVAFFWIGGPGRAMLGVWSGGSSRTPCDCTLLSGSRSRRCSRRPPPCAEPAPLDCHGQPTIAPSVIGWMPAAAVFFHDPDGHLLEYRTMLPHEPRPEAGVVPQF